MTRQRPREGRGLAGTKTRLTPALRLTLGVADLAQRLGVSGIAGPGPDDPYEKRITRKQPLLIARRGNQKVQAVERRVRGRDASIPVRIYLPADRRVTSPGILFIHGGGFITGGLDFCDWATRELAHRSGFPVVSLAYRLAPQHPYPAGLHDCLDVLAWMAETAPAGIDGNRMAVAGESAGANLAAALCIAARDAGGPAVRHQSIVYPFTDATLSSTDWDTKAMAGIDRSAGELMLRCYAPGPLAQDPLVSVLHADLQNLPPALVMTCDHDVLMTDGIRFAEALRAAGNDVRHEHYERTAHGFLTASRLTKVADQSVDVICEQINAHVA